MVRSEGNPLPVWAVVHAVGMKRAVAAAVAMGLVLAGCGSGAGGSGEGVTTTSTAAEKSGNPWAMPASERPPLFDPCAEIPIEAVREGAGPEARPDDELGQREPGQLTSCGWSTSEVLVSVLATWKSHRDYMADETVMLDPTPVKVGGRTATRLRTRSDTSQRYCRLLFFTERGTVVTTAATVTSLEKFRGKNFVPVCDVVDKVAAPLVEHFPEGDFR